MSPVVSSAVSTNFEHTKSQTSHQISQQPHQQSHPLTTNIHPMVTRSKVRVFKPKAYVFEVAGSSNMVHSDSSLNTVPTDVHDAMKST